MPRKIVLEGSDGAVEQLEEVSAANEAQLQNFLKANPELLPIEELELLGPMMVVGAETQVNSGAIDLVGVTPSADILLIEFKTGPQNPDFRQVLAHLLDYGSDVWAMSYKNSRIEQCDIFAVKDVEIHAPKGRHPSWTRRSQPGYLGLRRSQPDSKKGSLKTCLRVRSTMW